MKLAATMILTWADWRTIPGGAVWKGGRAALDVAWWHWPNPQVVALANGLSPFKVARLRFDSLLAPLHVDGLVCKLAD